MKYVLYFAVCSFLVSCGDKKRKAAPVLEPIAVYTEADISVQSFDFDSFEPMLHRENDTIYVVNFWATWCQPCIEELPHFEKLQSELKHQNVKMILVSMDMKKQVNSRLIPFIRDNKIQSQVVHLSDPDADAWINKVDPSWSGAIPATIIYRQSVRQFYERSFTYDELKTVINKFIRS